jgi:hypothetical protein
VVELVVEVGGVLAVVPMVVVELVAEVGGVLAVVPMVVVELVAEVGGVLVVVPMVVAEVGGVLELELELELVLVHRSGTAPLLEERKCRRVGRGPVGALAHLKHGAL